MNTRKIWLDLVKLLGVFALVWAALTWIPWFPDESSLEYPVESEIALGERIFENLVEDDPNFVVMEDSTVNHAVRVIANRLLDSIGLTEYDYNIVVSKDEGINAYALPGGNIVILSGLIAFAESPEEVAAVLAHEMGHVEERHVVNRLIKEFGLQILFSIMAGGDAVVLGEVSKTAASTYFDRKQEEEADAFSMDLMYRSKLDPRALAVFFRRLKREYQIDFELEMFQTHPRINARIKHALEYPVEEGYAFEPIPLDWEEVRLAAESATAEEEAI